MKTLQIAYRVSDLDRSLRFYSALGYRELLRVSPTEAMTIVMLLLPEDEYVTLELVVEPAVTVEVGTGFSHLVVQVEDIADTRADLRAHGIESSDVEVHGDPAVEEVTQTSFVFDPDGYRIELVQWPAGHGDGITEADLGA